MAAICSSTKEKDMDMESHVGFITANALFICCVIAYDCRHFMACLIYKKESIDNPVERGVQSKRGWSAVFSQEVKGKPLSRDYSSVYANVKHQKMKVHWGGLVLELSNTSLNNYLAHFRILKVVYKSKIVLVAR